MGIEGVEDLKPWEFKEALLGKFPKQEVKCIIKNCQNVGRHQITINVGEQLGDGIWVEESAREHKVYLCDEDFAIVKGVNYLSLDSTEFNTSKELTEQERAERQYPHHHPETALANYRAAKEVWDTNGDQW